MPDQVNQINRKLAKIQHASLNIKDRGILTFNITVNYEDGFSQGIGGYALDAPERDADGEFIGRIGTAKGCELLRRLLLELDVDDFSEMRDKIIWILGEGGEFDFRPTGIQALRINGGEGEGLIFKEVFGA